MTDNSTDLPVSETEELETDVLIIGSGPGGAAAALGLVGSGNRVIVAERGGFVPEIEASDVETAMYIDKKFTNAESWYDASNGRPFTPGTYYYVGGNTRFYGAALPRFRSEDFELMEMAEGDSKAWPFTYDELEPYYSRAEQLYRVFGSLNEDPTEPPHSEDFPNPALTHEPTIRRFSDSLQAQGLHPYHSPNGIRVHSQSDRDEERASDGTPSVADRKADAWNSLLRPALEADSNIRLLTDFDIEHLESSADGTALTGARGRHESKPMKVRAEQVILAAGAVNTAALLLRSGLANSSGMVGRNYMFHNTTFLIGFNPFRRNRTSWQKTIGVNDWYLPGDKRPGLGNMQMLGKLGGRALKGHFPRVPLWLLNRVAERSLDLCLISEDAADPENRIELRGNRIFVHWRRNNLATHRELVARVRKAVRKAGYPLIFTRLMGIATNSHACGTAVAGDDPRTSVVDRNCRSHDLSNLWITDSSVFPSSTASNPVLTITANALRVADRLLAATDRHSAEDTAKRPLTDS